MKKFCKGLIAAVLFVAVALSTVVTSYASTAAIGSAIKDIAGSSIKWAVTPVKANTGEDELVAAKNYLDSVWRPLDRTEGTVEVTYQTLSDVLADLNMNGIPCQLKQLRGAGPVGYVIIGAGTAPILDGYGKYYFSNKYFTNTAGAIFRADKDSSGGTVNNTYNYNQTTVGGSSVTPSTRPRPGGSVSSVVTDRELQERIYHSVDSLYQYMSLTIDWLRFVDKDICRIIDHLNDNVAPALEAINNNIISFKNSAVSTLRSVFSVLSDSYDVQFNLLGVARSIYSGVSGIASRLDALNTNTVGIGSRLDTVISNGVVQVGSASLEARLDKLISMYSKVNSVVLDTASLTSNSIKAAVGGELEDVVFWGTSGLSDKKFIVSDGTYTLNGAQYDIPVPLLGFTIGTSVPASFDASDPDLMAGVWRYNDGGTYRLSDTYNAATGEHVRRVGSVTYDGSEDWKMVAKDGCYLFYLSDPAFSHTNGNIFSLASQFSYVPYNSAFSGNASDSAIAYNYKFTVFAGKIMIVCQSPSVAAWKTWLKQQVAAGRPWTVWYQDKPTTTALDRTTIAISEGDSSISGYRVRITGKYETYDSYTQTADIIAAINRLNGTGIGGDLTAVTSRLDLILAELQSSSGSASCEHTYTQHMEQGADCILPGLMISTCSQCGDSYSEIVDPLGHDWVLSSHVDAVTDPDTGEETASAYDVYTCSRCGRTYEDHTGNGAPDEDYSNTSISQLVVQVFSKLGTFAGKLIGFFVHLLDKALTSVDNVISKFNDYTVQISSFGGSYPAWLTGFWGIIPSELQAALTFSVICMALGAVGKKLLFS